MLLEVLRRRLVLDAVVVVALALAVVEASLALVRRALADSNVLGVLETEPREVLDALRLRRGEQQRLAAARQVRDDGVERGGKAHVEDPVRLVEYEQLEVVALKSERLVHVLQQPSGCGDEDVHPRQALLLVLEVLAADDQSGRELVLVPYLAQDLEDLDRLMYRGLGSVAHFF